MYIQIFGQWYITMIYIYIQNTNIFLIFSFFRVRLLKRLIILTFFFLQIIYLYRKWMDKIIIYMLK